MRLEKLLGELEYEVICGDVSTDITAITSQLIFTNYKISKPRMSFLRCTRN